VASEWSTLNTNEGIAKDRGEDKSSMTTSCRNPGRKSPSLVWAPLVVLAAAIMLAASAQTTPGQVAGGESPQLVVQIGFVGQVNTMAFSPDGRWLASGGADPLICIWEAATGHLVRKLEGHTGAVLTLAFSPDGALLASGNGDETTILWDVASGKVQRRFLAPPGGVDQVAFSPDGRLLASGGGNGLAVWDVSNGKLLQAIGYDALKGHLFGFTPDGGSLIVQGDKQIGTWNLRLGRYSWQAPIEKGEQRHVRATSENGRLLALQDGGHADFSIWDAWANTQISRISSEPTGLLNPAAFNPDGKILACRSDSVNDAVRLWDVASGRELHALGKGVSTALAFSPDGRKLAVARQSIEIWDVASGSQLLDVKRNVERALRVRLSETKGKPGLFLLADSGHYMQIWDLANGRPLRWEHYGPSRGAKFARGLDGRVIIIAWPEGKAQLSDAITGGKLPMLVDLPSFPAHWEMNSDASLVAIAEKLEGEEQQVSIKVKEVATGRQVSAFVSKTDVFTMTFSNDSRWLLTRSAFNKSANLWDVKSGESKYQFKGEEFDLSPDGHRLAFGALWAGITVVDLETQTKRNFSGNGSAGFSPTGRYLTAGHDGPINVWEMESGQHILSLQNLKGSTGAKFFSPDERYLVVGTTQKEERIWEVSTGREVLPDFSQFIESGASLAFSGDSHWLAATASDGGIKLWDVDAEKLVASLYVLDEGTSWLVTTPDGFFDGPDNAVKKLITWNVGNQIFPVGRFAKQRYRPGLLADIFAKRGAKQ